MSIRRVRWRLSNADLVFRQRPLGHEELLARVDRRRGEVVPLLNLPDTLPRVARVRALCDRPERVAGPHDVGALRPGAARAARRKPDHERQSANENEELPEHLFAW